MTNIKNFDPNLFSVGQLLFKKSADCVIYYIEYLKNLGKENSLCLAFNDVDTYIEENNENKYLIFAFTDKNKEVLENCTELWDEIKDQIELESGNKPIEYKEDFIKIKFESNDNLPLVKIMSIPVCVINIRNIFQVNNKYYQQVFLRKCFYEYEYEFEDDSYAIL